MALRYSSMGPMDTNQPQKHPKEPHNYSPSVRENVCKRIKLWFIYGLTSCSTRLHLQAASTCTLYKGVQQRMLSTKQSDCRSRNQDMQTCIGLLELCCTSHNLASQMLLSVKHLEQFAQIEFMITTLLLDKNFNIGQLCKNQD